MKITKKDLIIDIDHLNKAELVKDWRWLIGEKMLPILVTSVGDMFLQDSNGSIHWLITGSAELIKVANTKKKFKQKINNKELANEWFLIPLVTDLKRAGVELEHGKLYGFKKLPILGGEYATSNFDLIDIQTHCSISGLLNLKLKDLPDGTPINFRTS